MDKKVSSIINHATDLTLGCLNIYSNWLNITKQVGIDELSHRSDKERYLITIMFSFSLAEAILKDLSSDEFSPALEKIVNDLHDGINKDKKLKKQLFNSMSLDPIDTLETCVWLSKQQQDETMNTLLITTAHLNYLAVNKIPTVPDNDQDKQLIKNGSKLKIGEPIFNGLSNIFRDHKLRITNFSQGIKRP